MGKSSAPPPPDYAAAATAQGEANVEAARLAGRLNNPNIYTPLGSRTVYFGGFGGTPGMPGTSFDEAGYNQALQQYQADLADYQQAPFERIGLATVPKPEPVAPTIEDFQLVSQGGGDVSGFPGGTFAAEDQPIIVESLTPEGQRLFDQQMRISQAYGDIAEGGLGRIGEAMGTEFDASMLPDVAQIDQAQFGQMFAPQFSQFQAPENLPELTANLPAVAEDVLSRERVEQALFDRLNPRLEEARRQREEALIMQGQGRGGRAWNTTQQDLAQAETEAQLGAILGAGQEQQRLFNMAMANRQRQFGENLASREQLAAEALRNYGATMQGQQAQFQGDLAARQATQQGAQALFGLQEANRRRALQESLALRQLPLSEINALRTGSQPTIPQFQAYQGQAVTPAPIFDATQAQYNADVAATNARNAARGQTFGALATLGGAALGGPIGASIGSGLGNMFGASAAAPQVLPGFMGGGGIPGF